MKRWKVVAVGLVVLAGIAAAGCTTKTTNVVSPPGTQTGISVSGSGRASGAPDVVILQLGVQSEARTVAAAREAAAQAAQAVIDSLKRNGVDEKDIRTIQFSVDPQYDFSGRTQVLRAYRVTNVVQAKVRRIDTAGKVIDDAVAAGGDQTVVRGISFSIEDTTKLEEAARADAVDEAHKRAEQLAKEAGVKLGKPLTVSEGTVTPIVAAPAAAPALSRAGDTVQTSIQPGELEVRVIVSVLYAIE